MEKEFTVYIYKGSHYQVTISAPDADVAKSKVMNAGEETWGPSCTDWDIEVEENPS